MPGLTERSVLRHQRSCPPEASKNAIWMGSRRSFVLLRSPKL